MFTGLIETTGRVERIDARPQGCVLAIATSLAPDLRAGDSIAVSGVCLTVASLSANSFAADVSRETLAVTTIGGLTAGRIVNLERPVPAGGRMGGHFVLGHVDAVGRIAALRPDGDGYWLEVETPAALDAYFIPRGSIAVDGVSLTIASLAPGRIGAQIVPFTFAHTALATARAGDPVNLEADVLGKYVARLLAARGEAAAEAPGLLEALP